MALTQRDCLLAALAVLFAYGCPTSPASPADVTAGEVRLNLADGVQRRAGTDVEVISEVLPGDASASDHLSVDDGLEGEDHRALDTVPGWDINLPDGLRGPCDPPIQPAISGLVYHDGDQSSDSYHAQGLFPAYDSPLPDVHVSLTNEEGTQLGGLTCEDGRFSFSALADGYYLLSVGLPAKVPCTSANRPLRLPAAVAEGEVVLVTIGDSIPTSGGHPPFPTLLAGFLGHLATVDNRNRSSPGTHTEHWLPGQGHFESKALPELADADVVIVSLGGNDLNSLLPQAGGGDIGEILAALDKLPEQVQEIIDNIKVVLAEIRSAAPDADIVYCVYLNYANSDTWKAFAGQYSGMIISGMSNLLSTMREELSAVPGVTIADVYGAVGNDPIDEYLADAVHLSDAGHLLYAEQVFLALGGARVGESPLGLERSFGFFFEQ